MNQINQQSPIKADRQDDGSLLVHSIFMTLQGEGPNAGQPAVFIRLGGCNLQCPQCDTIYTGGDVSRLHLNELAHYIEDEHHLWPHQPLVVITGGEPLRQNLIPLLNWLALHQYRMQIETNGTYGIDKDALSDEARYTLQIVCSPKTHKVVESLHEFIVAYKYVVNADAIDPADGLPETVLGLTCRPARPHAGYRRSVYLQPADENDARLNQRNTEAAIQSCMWFGHTFCLQMHKLIGLP